MCSLKLLLALEFRRAEVRLELIGAQDLGNCQIVQLVSLNFRPTSRVVQRALPSGSGDIAAWMIHSMVSAGTP